jgi:predicted outer membrane repeat protein
MRRLFSVAWVVVWAVGCTNPALFDYDGDGTVDAEDCAPENPDIYPGAKEECDDGLDNDCDGLVDALDPHCDDMDGDGYPSAVDCDDTDADIYPGGIEVCDDGVDNDCDTLVDDTDPDCDDPDGDGYPNAVDCAPDDPAIFPGADEICDDLEDNDCDGDVDDDDTDCWDADADGYPAFEDCDDEDADIHPGAEEVCDDVDNDCDGVTDNADATGSQTWYEDNDGDGWGNPDAASDGCDAPMGYVADATDCDDDDDEIHPAGTEVCNGEDDDCNGSVDGEDATDAETWYEDADHDGQGDPATGTVTCDPAATQVANGDDCDDDEPTVFLGNAELCDGLDNDCDTVVPADETDADGDGHWACGDDCDDTDALTYLGAAEICDGEDNDCDGYLPPSEQNNADGDLYRECEDCDDGNDTLGAGLAVPAVYGTIQSAIDAAAANDEICVAAGTYVENLDFLGKTIRVVGLEGSSSTIIDGSAGGPVVTFASGEDSNSTLEGVWLQGGTGTGGRGGGVYIDGASPSLVDVHISYITVANSGGGIYVSDGAPVFDDVQVTDCNAAFGAGIYLDLSDAVMSHVLVLDVAATQDGGGVYMIDSSPIIEDLVIGNASAANDGGGIYAEDSPMILQYSTINLSTVSGGDGGGVYLLRSDAELSNVVIADCESTVMQGGGLSAVNSSPVMSNTVFSRNTATTNGGGVHMLGSDGWFDAVKILGNEATGAGGGLFVQGGTHSLYNMVFHGNGNAANGGGIYATGAASLTMANCSITSNQGGMGAGLYCGGCTLTAANNNAFANSPDNYDGVFDPTGQDGNISENPLYQSTVTSDPLQWDLHVAPTSNLIDAGFAGLNDPDGSTSDIGAYGGVHAGTWDLDHDTFYEWWEPGTYSGGNWDCADNDPAAYPGAGC